MNTKVIFIAKIFSKRVRVLLLLCCSGRPCLNPGTATAKPKQFVYTRPQQHEFGWLSPLCMLGKVDG